MANSDVAGSSPAGTSSAGTRLWATIYGIASIRPSVAVTGTATRRKKKPETKTFSQVLDLFELSFFTQVEPPESFVVQLLDGLLQPPVGSHEGEGDGDFGVEGAQGPLLPGEEHRRLVQRHSNRHEDDDLEEETEEEGDEAHEDDHGGAGLQSLEEHVVENEII